MPVIVSQFLALALVVAGPTPTEALPPEVAAEVSAIETLHRAIVREPVANWRLEAVRSKYQALLQRVTDPAAGEAIRTRLEFVARHEEMAEAARTIETILARSRKRDRRIALDRRRLAAIDRPEARPYDAEGLVQASAREFEGRKVLALIGPEGTAVAYLDVPPGLDARPMIARRVGVRGDWHFNEKLRASLISVRDIEPLDERR